MKRRIVELLYVWLVLHPVPDGKGVEEVMSRIGGAIHMPSEQTFKVGDRVTWNSHGGRAEGKVIRVATSDGNIEASDYKASKDDPRYIVETDEGKRAAHKAEALKRA